MGREDDRSGLNLAYALLAASGLLLIYGTIRNGRKVQWGVLGRVVSTAYARLSNGKQLALTLITSLILYASAWMMWGLDIATAYRRAGDAANIVATLAAATIFYVSPWLVLTIISGLALLILIMLRLDLGLALVVLFAPFFSLPRQLFDSAFSMSELILIMCAAAFVLRGAYSVSEKRGARYALRKTLYTSRFTSLDLAVFAFLIVSAVAVLFADYKTFALREFRVIIIEPVIFYALIRSAKLDRRALWRLVDALILAGVLVAVIGLIQYAFNLNIITAEEGVRRLRSVYGSPNNVGLFLGRVFPIGLAVALLGARHDRRRSAYAVALIPIAAAIVFSQSRGAIFVGIPASILAIGLLAGGQWIWRSIGALAVAALASIPLLNSPRVQALFSEGGTSFFRIALWKSTLEMIRDHLLIGVGPDNFLYAYRDRYLRPEAWAESALSHPHNVVLDFAARLGLIGLGTFVWMQIAFWRTGIFALRTAKSLSIENWALLIGLMASMVDFLAHGLVDAAYFVVDLAFVFMLTLALVQQVNKEQVDK